MKTESRRPWSHDPIEWGAHNLLGYGSSRVNAVISKNILFESSAGDIIWIGGQKWFSLGENNERRLSHGSDGRAGVLRVKVGQKFHHERVYGGGG